ncbi:hypothetical protein BC938DRAFT_479883 [Jimgerdemannia flammicorona]|uniref:Amine oxidase domain-containing protein n=1 Tax=Jimgerdemannia flammicorona TaxID=994334 RepID=A0A433QJZ0_9FUNG|nr:hypothetical protein BC938DRAFT_479883 [Jimgerdemannia flammicorona]
MKDLVGADAWLEQGEEGLHKSQQTAHACTYHRTDTDILIDICKHAARFGANSHEDVAELALRDLVKIHGPVVRDEYLDHGVHYWSTDLIAGGGAFAFFEPGKFTTLLPHLKSPEFHIHFTGEHTDIHHGWIVGALNSAVYTTYNIMKGLKRESEFPEYLKPFIPK